MNPDRVKGEDDTANRAERKVGIAASGRSQQVKGAGKQMQENAKGVGHAPEAIAASEGRPQAVRRRGAKGSKRRT
jgi:hypothetical protein